MEIRISNKDLAELAEHTATRSRLPREVVSTFRRRLSQIAQATDEREFYAMRSYRFEKLSGDREGQHSIRLNDQWRLIVVFEGAGESKVVNVIEVVDYH
jgi:toxin HigB-1